MSRTTSPAVPTKPLTLVFFGYTHCPDICQVVMANIAAGLVRLDPAQRDEVGMDFVTTDPKRDTAKAPRAYVDRFDPKFEGLTGQIGAIEKAGQAFDLPIEKGHRFASGGTTSRTARTSSACGPTAKRRTSGPRGPPPTRWRTTSARSCPAR